MHVHVQREKMVCKFWIKPLTLARNRSFSAKELNAISVIIMRNNDKIIEGWHEHSGKNTGSEN